MELTWKELLKDEYKAPYFRELLALLDKERAKGKRIYPPKDEVFNALELTPFEEVKVVVIGQDPYHGAGQAHGLCFSVKNGVRPPPSLQNIFKELKTDLSIDPPTHGNLEAWAKQGVLLLNTVLTVEEGKAGSHHGLGWEKFTDKIIQVLNEKRENLVFLLWGSPAQKKAESVDPNKHKIIKSVHPSPLSSYRGFFGSKPFSQTNAYLISHGIRKIDWNL